MASMVKCDRCAALEPSSGLVMGGFGKFSGPRLPDAWKRVVLPPEVSGVAPETLELCGGCVNALREFLASPGEDAGPESTPGADSCTCPRPVQPRTPCPDHELTGEENRDPDAMQKRHHPAELHDFSGDQDACLCPGCDLTWGEYTGLQRRECPVASLDGCRGWYPVGRLDEHMADVHGPRPAGAKQCPYCPEELDGIVPLGQHIARAHPGDWQAWRDSGQKAG